jgi:predicted membrane protein
MELYQLFLSIFVPASIFGLILAILLVIGMNYRAAKTLKLPFLKFVMASSFFAALNMVTMMAMLVLANFLVYGLELSSLSVIMAVMTAPFALAIFALAPLNKAIGKLAPFREMAAINQMVREEQLRRQGYVKEKNGLP